MSSEWEETLNRTHETPEQETGWRAKLQLTPLPRAVMMKGQGIVPFDPAFHQGYRIIAAVRMDIYVQHSGVSYQRTVPVAGPEWETLARSLERLGYAPQYFNDVRSVRLRIVELTGPNGKPLTYFARSGEEKVKTAYEVVAVEEDEEEQSTNTPQIVVEPANSTEKAAAEVLQRLLLQQPIGNVITASDLITLLGAKRQNGIFRQISDERLRGIAQWVIDDERGIPF